MRRTNPAFVTGASGFIGRHLIHRLLAEGRPVTALCRRPDDLRDLQHPLLKIVAGTLEEPNRYASHLDHTSSVFHLAALRNLPGSSPAMFGRINVDATAAFGKLAYNLGVSRFIHVSTALVYGPSGDAPVDETSTWDANTCSSRYIQSKAAGQRAMMRLAQDGLRLSIICPTLVYGPDHPSHRNRLTSQARRLLKTRMDIVVGSGDRRRNLVAVQDVVEGMLLAEAGEYFGESFILGGEDCSFRSFNREVFTLSGVKPFLRLSAPMWFATPLAEIVDWLRGYDHGAGFAQALRLLNREWRYASNKARNLLGYSPRSLQAGLLDLIEFIKHEERAG